MRLSTVSLGLLAVNLSLVACWSNKDVVARDNAGGATASSSMGSSGGQQTRVSSLTLATTGGARTTLGATFAGGSPTNGSTSSSGGTAGIGGYITGGLANTGGKLADSSGGASAMAAGGSQAMLGGTNSGRTADVPTGGTSGTGSSKALGGSQSTTGTTTLSGTSSTGGTTSSGGSSSSVPVVDERPNPPCEGVEDCKLVNNCCTCDVYSAAAHSHACDVLECDAPQCEAKGIDASDIMCIGGRCTLVRSCDSRLVTCPAAAPNCPPGQLPMVESGCYKGGCTSVTSCRDVPSCEVCTAQGLSCATWHEMFAITYHCVNTPLDCNDTTNCECMGVCAFGYICNQVPEQLLSCVCPGC